MKKNNPLRRISTVLILGFLLLLLTRMCTIWHNNLIHPDEHVFFISAHRLAMKVMNVAPHYTQLVDYPEGAFVLHLPFHIAFELFTRVTGRLLSYRFIGRAASVCYFLMAVGVSLWILWKYFSNFQITSFVFLSCAIFGLMHIEQSRYGTGDPASFFLLMSLLAMTALGMEKRKSVFFGVGFFICGILGAIKYPQFYFLLIPLISLLHIRREVAVPIWKVLLLFAAIFPGYMLFSPTMLMDPMSAIRTLTTEFTNYVTQGNYIEHGGPLNHIAALTVYTLLYSGIPLIPALLAVKLVPTLRRHPGSDLDFLFYRVVPAVIFFFFVYNLFVSTLFMRTYYPFFCMVDLYCAALCGKLWSSKRARAFICAALAFMILRGSFYLYVLATDHPAEKLEQILSQAEGAYSEVTLLEAAHNLPFPEDMLPEHGEPLSFRSRFTTEDVALRPGELVVVGNMDYCWGQPYIFPVEDVYIPVWTQFKRENAGYRIGSLYPQGYYPLFGLWIKGTTGTAYELPSIQFYLRPTN